MPRCTAKSKQTGQQCKRFAAKGRTVCHYHGGRSPGAPKENQYARQHGIYARHLTPEEQELFDTVEVGTVDHELRLLRVRTARIMALEAQIDAAPNDPSNQAGFRIHEIEQQRGGV